jgi:N-acetyl-gamma-glutamyl-phosphate reductase
MRYSIGIAGVSGYGGGELLRLIATHPNFELTYAAGEGSAGSKLIERYPGLSPKLGNITIEKFDASKLPKLDVLFASLPTGKSSEPLSQVPASTKIVDIGGDHRYVPGWVYGLADVWPEKIKNATRVANPGCYPAASLTALAPLLKAKLISPESIIIDAKSGVSGAGRGSGDNKFGYAETNEDLMPYGLLKHTHMPEISATIKELAGREEGLVFTPHLIPMTRGILATIYARSTGDAVTTEACQQAAKSFYQNSPFVRVLDQAPHTKFASGSNLAFVHYAADPARKLVIALCVIDNLGKGAAGQALQNANLMMNLPADTGLQAPPVWP